MTYRGSVATYTVAIKIQCVERINGMNYGMPSVA